MIDMVTPLIFPAFYFQYQLEQHKDKVVRERTSEGLNKLDDRLTKIINDNLYQLN